MYLNYFSLQRHPFRITPDPAFFCSGGGRGEVLGALIYAITSGEGIIKVVGEVGSGKTMLCRILEERLPKTVDIVYLANPSLSPHDILYAVAFELRLPVTVETERLKVMQLLQEHLLKEHGSGRSVVVFIEEAQGMPVATLEEIRLLSNLETHSHKLLQIVLFGQPELDRNLGSASIRQLKERITHGFQLQPLSRQEVGEYLRFRLQAAGCANPALFEPAAERLIAQASRGLTRRVNILADKSLLAAYIDSSAAGTGFAEPRVCARHVRTAIRDSEFGRLPHRLARPVYIAAGALGFALLLGALLYMDPTAINRLHLRQSVPAVRTSGQNTESLARISPQPPPASAGGESAAVPLTPGQGEPETSLLEQRRQVTAQWLRTIHPEEYTIQLMEAESTDNGSVEKFLRQVSPASMLDKIFVCPVQQGRRQSWAVVYDSYSGVSTARRAIDAFPQELKRFQPYARRLGEMFKDWPPAAESIETIASPNERRS